MCFYNYNTYEDFKRAKIEINEIPTFFNGIRVFKLARAQENAVHVKYPNDHYSEAQYSGNLDIILSSAEFFGKSKLYY